MKINYKYLVFIGSYIFFLLSLVENFSASHDSINYLVGIAEGKNLIHPHHLLYHVTAYGWVQTGKLIFPFVPDYYLAASFSSLFGSGIITLAWMFFINRFSLVPAKAFAGICMIIFSYGIWFYSSNIEVYTPPLFFILLCIYYLSGPLSDKTLFKIFLFHFCAVLFHQVNILFSLIIIFYLWKMLKEQKYRFILQYILSGIMIVGGMYFIMGWFIEGRQTPESFMDWVLGYTYGHDYWQSISLSTPVKVIGGFIHAIIGGHFIFNVSGPESFIGSLLSSHNLEDEMFLARNLGIFWSWLLLVLTLVFVFYLLKSLIRFFLNFSIIRVHYSQLIFLLGGTFLLYSGFFIFWMPQILEFWIPQTVFMWLLLAGTFRVTETSVKKRFSSLIIMPALLLIINYCGSIHWLQSKDNDWYYKMCIPVKDVSDKTDLIMVNKGWIIKDYLDYFTTSSVNEVLPEGAWKEQIPLIDSVLEKGGKVFLYPGKVSLNEDPLISSFRTLLDRYKGDMYIYYDKVPEIWLIGPLSQ